MTAKKPGAVALRRRKCSVCLIAPAAMDNVEFCFGCWPGGPVIPPPCVRCGATTGYYTSGVCRRCHKDGDPGVDSCLDCYAWGATRHHSWLCHGCHTWRRNNPTVGPCTVCGRTMHVGNWGRDVCRLCYRQASMLRDPFGKLDLIGASRHGQQLYFADMFISHGVRKRRPPPTPPPPPVPVLAWTRPAYEQLVLFKAKRSLAAHGRTDLQLRADPLRAAELEQVAKDLSEELGWSARQLEDTCYGLRIILGIQDSVDEPVPASDVAMLRDIDLPVWTVLKVMATAGILDEDRTPAFDAWYANFVDGLPAQMLAELRIWFDVMKNGSPTAPRRRPRKESTVGLHIRWAMPILRAWAAAGHESLREITREQVLDDLPSSGNLRANAGQGLKSIFRLLKGRKVLFSDPTLRVKTGSPETKQPLPANVDALRAALNSTDLAQAAVVALIAFHGLRVGHLVRLQLTDIRDGRLHIDGRVMVLADPVRQRVAAYLDYRNRRWPRTTNLHLFVHYRTASRADPVGPRWIELHVGAGLSPAAIRVDRILDEAHATGGDARRLADLFGLSIDASTRYTATVDHPDLIELS